MEEYSAIVLILLLLKFLSLFPLCFSVFLHRWEEGDMGRFRSLIQGMVTQLDRQHGCIWASDDCTDQCYPPPDLQALLKLVLVPHIDNMSVQALVSIHTKPSVVLCSLSF